MPPAKTTAAKAKPSAKTTKAAKPKPPKKASAKRKTPTTSTPAAKAEAEPTLKDLGGRLIGITGPFGSVAIVLMPSSLAQKLFADDYADAAPLEVIEAVARDVAAIREVDEALADSALAAAAMTLARELVSPYNSATSKSMVARELREHLNRLRELAPAEEEDDRLDEIARARQARRARAAGGAGT